MISAARAAGTRPARSVRRSESRSRALIPASPVIAPTRSPGGALCTSRIRLCLTMPPVRRTLPT